MVVFPRCSSSPCRKCGCLKLWTPQSIQWLKNFLKKTVCLAVWDMCHCLIEWDADPHIYLSEISHEVVVEPLPLINIWCSLTFFDPKVSCEIPGDSHFEKHGSKVEGKCPPVSPCCAVGEASSQLRAAATAKQGGPATTAAVMKPQRCQVVTVCTS